MRDRDQYEWQEVPRPRLTAATFAVGTFVTLLCVAALVGFYVVTGR